MKLLKNFLKMGKTLYGHIASTVFDTDNPKTVVEEFMKSTEPNTYTYNEEQVHSDVYEPLSDAPNIDYYMEAKDAPINVNNGMQKESTKEQNMEESAQDEECGNKLIFELSNLIEELNRLNDHAKDGNVNSTIMFCENRIIEILLSCGCESIDEDSVFDNSRHVPQPFSFVKNGCTINKIIKPGLSYKNKVLVKAIVECEK